MKSLNIQRCHYLTEVMNNSIHATKDRAIYGVPYLCIHKIDLFIKYIMQKFKLLYTVVKSKILIFIKGYSQEWSVPMLQGLHQDFSSLKQVIWELAISNRLSPQNTKQFGTVPTNELFIHYFIFFCLSRLNKITQRENNWNI